MPERRETHLTLWPACGLRRNFATGTAEPIAPRLRAGSFCFREWRNAPDKLARVLWATFRSRRKRPTCSRQLKCRRTPKVQVGRLLSFRISQTAREPQQFSSGKYSSRIAFSGVPRCGSLVSARVQIGADLANVSIAQAAAPGAFNARPPDLAARRPPACSAGFTPSGPMERSARSLRGCHPIKAHPVSPTKAEAGRATYSRSAHVLSASHLHFPCRHIPRKRHMGGPRR